MSRKVIKCPECYGTGLEEQKWDAAECGTCHGKGAVDLSSVDRVTIEDLLRWRSWPEEQPAFCGKYLVMYKYACMSRMIISMTWGYAENGHDLEWKGCNLPFDSIWVTGWRPVGSIFESEEECLENNT